MESYKVAEEQILTELPTKYPQLFELFILIKTLLNVSFGTKFSSGDAYATMFVVWIISGIISAIALMVGVFNPDKFSLSSVIMGVVVLEAVVFLIHMVMGRVDD